jgi:hypothetical protein
VFPVSALATSPSQESIRHHASVVHEIPSPFLSVDTERSVSKSLEHERAALAVTILSQPSTPLRQSLHVLSRNFPLDNSGKTTGDGSSLTTLSPSDSTLFDYPSISVTFSPDFKAPSTVSVASLIEIGHLEPEPPNNTPLVSEATKGDIPTRLDPSNIARVPEPGVGSTLHDKSMSPPAIEDAPDLNVDEEDQQPDSESESEDEETFDYRGVDWTPEVLGTTPAPTAESQGLLPDLHPLSGSHVYEPAPSPSAKPAVRARVARYALDDIQVGIKGRREDKTTSITRCTSVCDFGGTLEATKITHGNYSIGIVLFFYINYIPQRLPSLTIGPRCLEVIVWVTTSVSIPQYNWCLPVSHGKPISTSSPSSNIESRCTYFQITLFRKG